MKNISLHAGSLLVTLVLLAGVAFAQSAQKVSVPFKFTAGSSALPAGTYYFATQTSASIMEVRDASRKVVSLIPVITRLAKGSARSGNSTRLVFDTVEQERYLSEVWIADADGFLVRATAEKHEHAVVPPDM